MKKHLSIILIITAWANSTLFSQTTVFDYSFNGDGIVTANPGPDNNGKIYDMVVQPDGKILVGGATTQPFPDEDFLLMRYNTNGTLDNTFGTGGIVITAIVNSGENIRRLALQPDGKILAYGQVGGSYIGVARYNTNGTLDNTFGTGGIVTWDLTGVGDMQIPANIALQSDNKIVLGATTYGHGIYYTDFTFGRLNTNGTIDSAYGSNGIVNINISFDYDNLSDIAIQPDDKIVAVGTIQNPNNGNSTIVTARFNSDGTYDGDFNGGFVFDTVSTIISDYINAVIIQPDGKVLIGGTSSGPDASRYLLMRYNSNGTPDNTFGTNGVVVRNFNSESHYMVDMLLMPNGKILAMGNGFILGGHTHFARFNANGTTDNTFNSDGHAEVDISNGVVDNMLALAIQTDGKILAAGFTDTSQTGTAVIARFTANMIPVVIIGINEYLFNSGTPLIYPNPLQATETLKYILKEQEQISITMIDAQGKLVSTFIENETQGVGEHEVTLSMPNLTTGTYFIQIASPKGLVSIKVVK